MFHEPIPFSPVIDLETFQAHLVPEPADEWAAYRAYPSYDPAFEDDVLEVRASHPACGRGAGVGASCTDPDPDDDLYLTVRDNRPGTANPDQADLDADGRGDACDEDDNGECPRCEKSSR
jgi:hypothetical protein